MDIQKKIESRNIKNVKNLSGKKIILRIDINIPIGDDRIVNPGDSWRIVKSIATIEFLRDAGASVVLLAHIGRDKESLKPIFEYMSQSMKLGFIPNYNYDVLKQSISNMAHGSVLMLENVRQFDEEIQNEVSYLNDLIGFCDIYVNDAFSVSHREHASVNAITEKLPSYFGLQFIEEVQQLNNFMFSSNKTKTLILGGAKFKTKIKLLEKMLPTLDYVLVGGAIANVFLKARGFKIGKSLWEDVDVSKIINSEKIILPIDYIDEHGDVADIQDVSEDNMILDIGPATTDLFETIIDNAEAIMWNGPMGKYEDGFSESSIDIADSISRTKSFSVTGGGDTSSLIFKNNLEDKFSFISTGGGAMLDFLLNGTLPGIDVIINKKS